MARERRVDRIIRRLKDGAWYDREDQHGPGEDPRRYNINLNRAIRIVQEELGMQQKKQKVKSN